MNPDTSHLAISAVGLTRVYPLETSEVIGIDQINLEIEAGKVVVLKGESGSGKSTLLSLLAGLDRPTEGQLKVGGYNLNDATDSQLTYFRRRVVGMVFQSFNLLPTLDTLENICLPALLNGKSFTEIRPKAMGLVEWLGLKKRLNHMPTQLSGGEMQRTAIARALINDPAIILADEPTGNLDSRNGQIVIDLLAELNRKWKCTVLIATHSALADEIASLKFGLKDGVITDLA